MANTLDPIFFTQMIALHLDGYSNRKNGSTLDISRNTVNPFDKLFMLNGSSTGPFRTGRRM